MASTPIPNPREKCNLPKTKPCLGKSSNGPREEEPRIEIHRSVEDCRR